MVNSISQFSLPKEAKLRLRSQYDLVREKGVLFRGRFFHLACLRDVSISAEKKCGVIVSRRVGGAVIRNKVKRRMRDLYRHDRCKIKSGSWLAVIAMPKAATASMADLRSEWLRLLQKHSIK